SLGDPDAGGHEIQPERDRRARPLRRRRRRAVAGGAGRRQLHVAERLPRPFWRRRRHADRACRGEVAQRQRGSLGEPAGRCVSYAEGGRGPCARTRALSLVEHGRPSVAQAFRPAAGGSAALKGCTTFSPSSPSCPLSPLCPLFPWCPLYARSPIERQMLARRSLMRARWLTPASHARRSTSSTRWETGTTRSSPSCSAWPTSTPTIRRARSSVSRPW